MSVGSAIATSAPFEHEAFFYADDEEYLAGTVPFIEAGLDAGEPVLVAVPSPRLELLRTHFDGSDDSLLRFAPMEQLGRNPGWIIPAWTDFVGGRGVAGRPARGIGEPIWHGRAPDELVECGRHEALLNVAFADAHGFTLLCPYDTSKLADPVIAEAQRNHPRIARPGGTTTSPSFDPHVPPSLDTPLAPVPEDAEVVAFDASELSRARRWVAQVAEAAGLPPSKVDDLVLAVSEAITNSVTHGGGSGHLALWREGCRFLCEIRDRGRIVDPLAGRRRPDVNQAAGRGLWLMNQLSDLMQIRQFPDGQAIRLHLLA